MYGQGNRNAQSFKPGRYDRLIHWLSTRGYRVLNKIKSFSQNKVLSGLLYTQLSSHMAVVSYIKWLSIQRSYFIPLEVYIYRSIDKARYAIKYDYIEKVVRGNIDLGKHLLKTILFDMNSCDDILPGSLW